MYISARLCGWEEDGGKKIKKKTMMGREDKGEWVGAEPKLGQLYTPLKGEDDELIML